MPGRKPLLTACGNPTAVPRRSACAASFALLVGTALCRPGAACRPPDVAHICAGTRLPTSARGLTFAAYVHGIAPLRATSPKKDWKHKARHFSSWGLCFRGGAAGSCRSRSWKCASSSLRISRARHALMCGALRRNAIGCGAPRVPPAAIISTFAAIVSSLAAIISTLAAIISTLAAIISTLSVAP